MTWMMTVFLIPLAFISASSISGVASKSGTLAPGANGNCGSCFQTCTCGTKIRSIPRSFEIVAAAVIFSMVRRVISGIDRFQGFGDVGSAALVAYQRPVSRDIQIDTQPALVLDAAQDLVARGKVDFSIAEIIGVGEVFGR